MFSNKTEVTVYLEGGILLWEGKLHQVPAVGEQIKLPDNNYQVVTQVIWKLACGRATLYVKDVP